MKKYIFPVVVLLLTACSEWTELKDIDLQKPVPKPDSYYEALRAYKASDHQIAFGWFGHWDPDKPSPSNSFKSVPDSMDILSLWGWGLDTAPVTEAKRADIAYMQDVLGTRITATLLLQWLPEQFDETDEGIRQYADAIADRINDENLEGLDIDWEPGITGYHFWFMDGNRMEVFVRQVGTRLGPQSKSGKLLMIDGLVTSMPKDLVQFFDYAIYQSYEATSYTSLQGSASSAINFGWRPEQLIFTETFERRWNDGGPQFEQRDGSYTNSLSGMGAFQPMVTVDGVSKLYRKGGLGIYHMEYDYNNNPDYKYTSKAIQAMNPAGQEPYRIGVISGQEESETEN